MGAGETIAEEQPQLSLEPAAVALRNLCTSTFGRSPD